MTATAAPPVLAGEIVHAAPGDLIIGANVRLDPRLDADFLASIRDNGVLVPITAYADDDGRLVVIDGQRRTLAAVQADGGLVPVWVQDAPGEEHLITEQVIVNDHRAALTVADRAQAYRQLEAIGLDAATIAGRTSTPQWQVEKALAVAKSPVAVGTVGQYPAMTLDQAAAIAEFDGDKDAVGELVKALEEGRGFDHAAQQLRDERAVEEAIAALTEELRGQDVAIWDAQPPWSPRGGVKECRLDGLAGAKPGSALTSAKHKGCPGHAVFVSAAWRWQSAGERKVETDVTYLCTDWRKHGHADRYGSTSSSSAGGAEKSEKDKAKESAERKRVIAGNKAWKSATKVRRDWLTEFAQRKAAPDGVERFIAETFVRADGSLQRAISSSPGRQLLDKMLGEGARAALGDELATAGKGRALVITATLLLVGWEADAHDSKAWREQTYYGKPGPYLAAMATFGYELASIEQALVDGRTWKAPAS